MQRGKNSFAGSHNRKASLNLCKKLEAPNAERTLQKDDGMTFCKEYYIPCSYVTRPTNYSFQFLFILEMKNPFLIFKFLVSKGIHRN